MGMPLKLTAPACAGHAADPDTLPCSVRLPDGVEHCLQVTTEDGLQLSPEAAEHLTLRLAPPGSSRAEETVLHITGDSACCPTSQCTAAQGPSPALHAFPSPFLVVSSNYRNCSVRIRLLDEAMGNSSDIIPMLGSLAGPMQATAAQLSNLRVGSRMHVQFAINSRMLGTMQVSAA